MSLVPKSFPVALIALVLSPLAVIPESWGKGGGANGTDRGGGIGVLCGDRLQTLDLYEAEKIHHMTLSRAYPTFDENFGVYGFKLQSYLSEAPLDSLPAPVRAGMVAALKGAVMSRFKDIPMGKRLPRTQDATMPQLPIGCKRVQIAVYDDATGVIQRDSEYWAMLSPQEQAALVLHEGIYFLRREQGALTSDGTRKLIGRLMSESAPPAILEPIWKAKDKLWCSVGDGSETAGQEVHEFFVVDEERDGRKGVGLYFRSLRGKFPMTRISSFVPGESLETFLGSRKAKVHALLADEFGMEQVALGLNLERSVSETPLNAGEIAIEVRMTAPEAVHFSPSYGKCTRSSSGKLPVIPPVKGASSKEPKICAPGQNCVQVLTALYESDDAKRELPTASELEGWWSARCATPHLFGGTRLKPSVFVAEPTRGHPPDASPVEGGVGLKLSINGSEDSYTAPMNGYDRLSKEEVREFKQFLEGSWSSVEEAKELEASLASRFTMGQGGHYRVRKLGSIYIAHNLDNPMKMICYFDKKVEIEQ